MRSAAIRLSAMLALIFAVAAFDATAQVQAPHPKQEIIEYLQNRFGLSDAQVRGALGALLVYARERLPKPQFDDLAQDIPNAERIMQNVKQSGIVTRPLDNIGEYQESLSMLGIGQPLASEFAPAVLDALRSVGLEHERDILAGVLD